MPPVSLDKFADYATVRSVQYAQHAKAGAKLWLQADLYLPKATAQPAPLLIWLGAGILAERAANPVGPQRLAGFLTQNGVGLAVPRVRVDATQGDVAPSVMEHLAQIELHRDIGVDGTLSSFSGLAATEDLCALLSWVQANASHHGLSGQTVLAGASLGAGLAFNVAVAAPHLGLRRPQPVGVLSYSGMCAWPVLFTQGALRVFALHNPIDRRVSITSVRTMAARDPFFELIESIEQAHGSLGLWPQESSQQACARILTRVQQWCAP